MNRAEPPLTPGLSVVIPCYNEGDNILLLLEAFHRALRENPRPESVELILVDNNSTDGTAEILRRELTKEEYSFAKTVFQPNPGYGAAIRKGLEAAAGEVLAWTHADLQTDPRDALRAYAEYQKYGDPNVVVKGNRVKRPLSQVFLSAGMAAIASVALGTTFREINAQPKLFHRSFLKHLANAPDDFSLDLYFLYQAKRQGYRIETIDVYFKTRVYGQSKWAFSLASRLQTIRRTIRYIFSLKKRRGVI